MWRFGLARLATRSGGGKNCCFLGGLPTGYGGEIDLGEMSENGPILTRPLGPSGSGEKKRKTERKKEINERSENVRMLWLRPHGCYEE
jgi:hypothetical protein